MTRTYAARRLLEHGPLTFREFCSITGWKVYRCNNVLIRLRKQGRVKRANVDGRSCYALA
jgi:hypothetical protein